MGRHAYSFDWAANMIGRGTHGHKLRQTHITLKAHQVRLAHVRLLEQLVQQQSDLVEHLQRMRTADDALLKLHVVLQRAHRKQPSN